MRRLKYIIVLVVSAVLVTCSEEPERIIYSGQDFVFIDSKPQVSLSENQTTPLAIPVKVSLAQKTNTKIFFEVIGINVLPGSDYRVLIASPLEIERGKYDASVSILPVNNNVIQSETRTIIVKILGVDNPELGVQVVSEVRVNLLDDDCPPTVPKVSIWTATGNVTIQGESTVTGTAEAGAAGICGGTLVVKGKFFGNNNPDTSAIIILTQNSSAPGRGFASVVRFPLFEGGTRYDYEASGTYDETTKNITLNFTVYDTEDKTQFTGTHVITPK